MNYEEMSDFEINKLVAMRLGKSVSASNKRLNSQACILITDIAHEYVDFDPCNNPSDAWSILIENKIDIAHTVSGHVNCAVFKPDERGMYREFYTTTCDNPLRAAMICFLKMKESYHD